MQSIRKIIHIDMDAFYASVEQRDRPEFKGKPVIVGGDPKSRGVVAACSYEARKFGIHSALPSVTAYRLCPDAVFIRPRFDMYREVSAQLRKFFGVGKVTEEKMLNLGIKTGADLKKYKKEQLIQIFGKSGRYFFDISHGFDDRPVEPNRIRKSKGKLYIIRRFLQSLRNRREKIEKLINIKLNIRKYSVMNILNIEYFYNLIVRIVFLTEPTTN